MWIDTNSKYICKFKAGVSDLALGIFLDIFERFHVCLMNISYLEYFRSEARFVLTKM